MNYFKVLLLTGLMAMPAICSAGDYPWLTFRMIDNTEISVATDNIDMSYSAGMLNITSSNFNQALNVHDIKSMLFSATESSSGIDDLAEEHEEADYYTSGGTHIGKFSSIDEARSNLPSGVYIGKTTKKSFKLIF